MLVMDMGHMLQSCEADSLTDEIYNVNVPVEYPLKVRHFSKSMERSLCVMSALTRG